MRFNINDKITVRLSEEACERWPVGRQPVPGEPYTDQAWVILGIVGPLFQLHRTPPFVGCVIEFDEDSCS